MRSGTQPFAVTEPFIVSGRDVTAVLGPTNTGKTHLALERMLAHESGIIGLPLRLLAREVYNKLVAKVGADKVALVTGEEKIIPSGAKYSVCTVEALPRQTNVAFVAIDEVQLAADLERGHIFTDRILHLRGKQETLLLGAATMRGILEKLLRGINIITRPRLSQLVYAGSKKITRLPRRSAIVAFSADEVYAIAELIRRQRGGAAVVMGALSPRTRNAQVELYQNGDVDFLVATDAIGMGLNLDVDHVAFAQARKFDGFQYRDLNAGELGQIAGRAGRHLRDGTFGVTGQVDPFDRALVERVESHNFDAAKVLQWRTVQFDFANIRALRHSLERSAPIEGLTRALPAVDMQALENLSRDDDIARLADNPKRVEILWDACALPDYRRIAPAQHADIIAAIYKDIVRKGFVDEDYMSEQVRRSDRTDGEIDTLSHRIAQIRTWTYVSHRPGWLADPTHWQEKTREIEDRLSDALHERLTKRFVDRRTSVLMKRLRENAMLEAEISPTGDVLVEDHNVGQLEGFRFTADVKAEGSDAKAVKGAAQKALAAEYDRRAERFAAAANGDFALGSDGIMRWIGAPVATLVAGDSVLKPRAVLLADEQLTGASREKVQSRIERFVSHHIETVLKPLHDLTQADALTGMTRGLAFRLVENFGTIQRREIAEEIRGLDQDSRAALRRFGVRFGAYHVFIPALLKPAPAGLMTLLWALSNDGRERAGYGDVVQVLAAGRTSVVVDPSFDPVFYNLAGYRVLGRRAVRFDILERLADLIRPALAWRPGTGLRAEGAYDGSRFMVTPSMMSILGATPDDMEEVLKSLGYRHEALEAPVVTAKLAELDAFAEADAAKKAEEKPVEAVAELGAEAIAAEATQTAPASAVVETAEAAPVAEVVTEVTEGDKAEALIAGEAAETVAAEEPVKMILLWRPGRSDNRNQPREQNRNRPRPQGNRRAPAKDGAVSGEAPVAVPADKDNQGRENRSKRFEKAARVDFRNGEQKSSRSDHPSSGKPRHGKRDHGQDQKRHERTERPVQVDPDSPFAKLLALKEQLKK
ncbi:helicase-related protein [Pseudochrobactrum sp. MP213Fo]|uniref:helicase-related protein n=1 Tax=Pseudochrobactrum sp. MP213Fo TaxID=3022250 RepID=UPI003BA28877